MSLPEAMALTDTQLHGLLSAYLERKRIEAKIMMSIVAEAMGTGPQAKRKPEHKMTSLHALAAMGFGIRGA